jgi:hypothetical protein
LRSTAGSGRTGRPQRPRSVGDPARHTKDLVEARGLYAKHGYTEIPAYNSGEYADHWFEKKLD